MKAKKPTMSDQLLIFTQTELNDTIEKIWNREAIKNSDSPTPVNNPKVFIWGGPPGAGKSSSMTKASKMYFDNNSLIISGDD